MRNWEAKDLYSGFQRKYPGVALRGASTRMPFLKEWPSAETVFGGSS